MRMFFFYNEKSNYNVEYFKNRKSFEKNNTINSENFINSGYTLREI